MCVIERGRGGTVKVIGQAQWRIVVWFVSKAGEIMEKKTVKKHVQTD